MKTLVNGQWAPDYRLLIPHTEAAEIDIEEISLTAWLGTLVSQLQSFGIKDYPRVFAVAAIAMIPSQGYFSLSSVLSFRVLPQWALPWPWMNSWRPSLPTGPITRGPGAGLPSPGGAFLKKICVFYKQRKKHRGTMFGIQTAASSFAFCNSPSFEIPQSRVIRVTPRFTLLWYSAYAPSIP